MFYCYISELFYFYFALVILYKQLNCCRTNAAFGDFVVSNHYKIVRDMRNTEQDCVHPSISTRIHEPCWLVNHHNEETKSHQCSALVVPSKSDWSECVHVTRTQLFISATSGRLNRPTHHGALHYRLPSFVGEIPLCFDQYIQRFDAER